MKIRSTTSFIFNRRSAAVSVAFCFIFALFAGLSVPVPFNKDLSFAPPVEASNTYYDFSSGSLSLILTPTSTNMITSNDDWTGVASVEGYFGQNLTATHGIDPQTVLGTEFAGNDLPGDGDTQVNANKGNPSAYNAGGVTEFDTGTYLAFGFQGNVQANPYMVFYLNTTGHTNVTMNYQVQDIDGGSNNAVSPIALQYRVGTTGTFTNVPAGFIADATDGPNIDGRTTSRSVLLPAAVNNQPQVQVRLITTNAANTGGSSTPDEWIGVNNVVISVAPPTAANVSIGGRVYSPYGSPLSNAIVSMYDPEGNLNMTRTNPFGYYRFDDVEIGQTYIVAVSSKRFYFSQSVQVVFVTDAMESLDFFADPIIEKQSRFETFKMKY
jgi:hypothetical protein